MTALLTESRYPDLPGFDKRNRELVYAMIDAGWTGRVTSKRHFLAKAPDGKTTITVPSKDGSNRGFANSKAQFMRWIKAHSTPEIQELWDVAVESDDPLIKDVLADSIVKKQAQQIVSEQMERAEKEFIEAMKKSPQLVIEPLIRPYLARKHSGKDGGTRYESQTTLERIWPDGSVDYTCALDGCDYASEKSRSVAMHYGQEHTRKGETEPAGEGPHVLDPDYTEPLTSRYRPTERLLTTLAGFLAEHSWDNVDDLALLFLTWANERPDLDHEPRPLVPLTDRQMIDKIRLIVGQPDQSEEIAALKQENLDLANEVTRLKEERAALRDLLSEGE